MNLALSIFLGSGAVFDLGKLYIIYFRILKSLHQDFDWNFRCKFFMAINQQAISDQFFPLFPLIME